MANCSKALRSARLTLCFPQRFVLLASCLLFAGCAATSYRAAPDVGWPAAPREFASADAIVSTANEFPNSAGMQRRKLAAAMEAKDAAGAIEAARRLALMGAVLSRPAQAQLSDLIGTASAAPIRNQMAANGAPAGVSDLYAEVPALHRLIEGIVWDEARHQLYVTSVVDRALVRVGGARAGAIKLDAGSLLGAAFDPRSRRLWITSALLDVTPPGGSSFAGLISLDPDAPDEPVRKGLPAGGAPGDAAVASDGTVFASDGLNGAIYRCRPGCSSLETLIPPGKLFSAQGLALSPDQRLLYIADRRYGLAALERKTGQLKRVTAPDNVMLDGIDGLIVYHGDLIATQTAYPPTRIIRLRLAGDGTSVRSLEVLERENPDWGEVTLMTLVGDRLVYVADAQWRKFESNSSPVAEPLAATPLRVIRLDD
jgi:hypothetical protein